MKRKIQAFTTSLPAIPGVKAICEKVEAKLPVPKISRYVPAGAAKGRGTS